MKKAQALLVTAAVATGLVAATAPARAASTCRADGAGVYVCAYGITEHKRPYGEKEQFVVGADYAVWTRWTSGGTWSSWKSLGGVARSKVDVGDSGLSWGDAMDTVIYVIGTDGAQWTSNRPGLNKAWTPWRKLDQGGPE
ncbi:hypothetical protein ABT160_31005 [Streptomyces sp. NPDC001941]|uniref:hypothetical protein n=1 Tax=Streptomyces sp. NPDC001941 TaxID=3154659 RepID=UPI003332D74F